MSWSDRTSLRCLAKRLDSGVFFEKKKKKVGKQSVVLTPQALFGVMSRRLRGNWTFVLCYIIRDTAAN